MNRRDEEFLGQILCLIGVSVIFIYIANGAQISPDVVIPFLQVILGLVLTVPTVALFGFVTYQLYTPMIFESRQAFCEIMLFWSTATMYTGCLVQSLWFSIRAAFGKVGHPRAFWILVFLDVAVFSIVTKRAELTHKRSTQQPMPSSVYLCCLLVPALVLTLLRLWCDPVCWKLVSHVFSKSLPFVTIWISPLLFEYFLVPEYSEDRNPLFGSYLPWLWRYLKPRLSGIYHHLVLTIGPNTRRYR